MSEDGARREDDAKTPSQGVACPDDAAVLHRRWVSWGRLAGGHVTEEPGPKVMVRKRGMVGWAWLWRCACDRFPEARACAQCGVGK